MADRIELGVVPLPDSQSALRVARECSIPSLIPRAFHHLSMLPAPRTDFFQLRNVNASSPRFHLVTHDDLTALILGRRQINKNTSDALAKLCRQSFHAACRIFIFNRLLRIRGDLDTQDDVLTCLRTALMELPS